MKKNKVRDIVIDADHILYLVTESQRYKEGFDGDVEDECDDFGEAPKVSLKKYKQHFKDIVDDYVTTAEVESICYKWTIGKVRVILSDSRNFRYDLSPTYKSKRPSSPELRKKLKKWAMKKYTVVPNCEADEVCCYYVREQGAIGFTTDKDVFNTEGKWFNCHHAHKCWVVNSKKDAERFMWLQVLAGDSVDNIDGIKGVGMATAKKLLDTYGWGWDGVVSAYKSKGLKKADAVLTRNLVDMTIWTPEDGVTLHES